METKMDNRTNPSQLIRRYFQGKTRQLHNLAQIAICEHPGLIGSHREELQRIYLNEILPKRYSVSRGMVYGEFHRSYEADIVIWDSQNYPSLPLSDHSFFFAESVRLVLECKSTWSTIEFKDVLRKCEAAKSIFPRFSLTLERRVENLEQEVFSIVSGNEHSGAIIAPHHIATAAVFLSGGTKFSIEELNDADLDWIDDCWPDLTLFLEAGKVMMKRYEVIEGAFMGGKGSLELYDVSDDSLLLFTVALIRLISDRSAGIEGEISFESYLHDFSIEVSHKREFPLRRVVPQRSPLWK